ncbi:heme-degrading domain-containing protein [Blastococcus sp. TF02-8]|uniref:heme-degrading domain-containing protein n=1 Tax=Blastococcus sp. TF02-8 TaxID=2250574 RepID=UPI000DE939EB|nr:heme-degrading domain-containing protein [Blastococcus sp. TF02-8]RBY97644.1 heme-degrading domain-containing protein [Blastococcus sp. TF02-8]
MADPFPSVAELAAEESELQFGSFTNDDAWELGSALVAAGRAENAPVQIEIARNGHRLFSAALPGATPDNVSWIERKSRVVHRFGHSSLLVGQASRERGTSFEAEFGLDPARYAAHGGAFPLLVRDVGPVGVVAVSGLPQLADHRMVVDALRARGARP